MDTNAYILTVYDEDGNPIGIPAIQGRGIESIKRTAGDGSAGTTSIYTITYSDGTTSTFAVPPGAPGSDYVLTESDKTEIAEEAAALVDTALLGIIGEVK